MVSVKQIFEQESVFKVSPQMSLIYYLKYLLIR